jgi:hypothetical protein
MYFEAGTFRGTEKTLASRSLSVRGKDLTDTESTRRTKTRAALKQNCKAKVAR